MIRLPPHGHTRPAQCADGKIRGPIHERWHQDLASRDGKQQERKRERQRARNPGADDRDDRGLDHERERELLEPQHLSDRCDEPECTGKKYQRETRPPGFGRDLREGIALPPGEPKAYRDDHEAVRECLGAPPDRNDGNRRRPVECQDAQHCKGHGQYRRVPQGRPYLNVQRDQCGVATHEGSRKACTWDFGHDLNSACREVARPRAQYAKRRPGRSRGAPARVAPTLARESCFIRSIASNMLIPDSARSSDRPHSPPRGATAATTQRASGTSD